MNLKGERVASDLRKELSNLLITEAKDEDFKTVTITHVKVTNDLSYAKIYFTALDDKRIKKIEQDLNNASGFFRSLLASKLNIRHTPELKFIYDESIEYAKKIEDIIKKISEGQLKS